jgi:uncharacterized protein (TIGR03435 family)
MRRFWLSVLVSTSAIFAQTEKKPSFEVVAIKLVSRPMPQNPRDAASQFAFKVDGAQVEIRGFPPLSIIARAFRVPPQRVVAPDFARSQYFEIRATLPEGANPDQVPEMLQSMLNERFKLAYHREMREYTFDVISVGKGGKLPRLPDNTPPSTKRTPVGDGGTHIVQVGTISSFFPVMNSFGGLNLLDETGLPGIYSWVRDQQRTEPGMTYQDVVQGSFRDMITSAGLKLDTRKVPQDTIVVDHLEKVPTEN